MADAGDVLSTFSMLVGLLVVGRILAHVDIVGERGADRLNRAAIAGFFPAVILRQAPGLHLDPGLLLVPAIAWCLIGLGVVVGVALHRRGADRGVAVAVALGLGFGNTAFLGYTLVPALLGEDALRFVVVFDQLGSFIGLSTVGLVGISLAAGGPRPTVATMVRKILVFPPFIALVVGVTVMPAAPPAWLDLALVWLGKALLPTMAVALGVRLRWRVPVAIRAPLAGVVVGKLVVSPAVALGLAALLGVEGLARDVVVLQAGMPVMVTVGALLTFAGVATDLATAMVAATTLLSMVTLPAWAALLERLT